MMFWNVVNGVTKVVMKSRRQKYSFCQKVSSRKSKYLMIVLENLTYIISNRINDIYIVSLIFAYQIVKTQ